MKVKNYLKEAKDSTLKELNFKTMFKDFSEAKGLGRVIPGINIVSKTLSLYDGLNECLAASSIIKKQIVEHSDYEKDIFRSKAIMPCLELKMSFGLCCRFISG